MIVPQRLHHVAVVVTDLEAARDFYGRILGLREVPRPAFDFPGAWYDLGGGQLHLIVHPGAQAVRRTRDIDGKDAHFALRVESYDETLAHLEREGVNAVGNPHSITGWAQIFCCDPDGNVIELNAEVKPI